MTNPNFDNDRQKKQAILRSYLEYPGETPKVDYKASIEFDGKSEFSLKLIRHILGFANAGGGYIVIGFPEGPDGKPQHDPSISNTVLASYEPTTLPQMVAKKIAGTDTPKIIVHHIDFKGNRYPIIEIDEFAIRPFFCRSDHIDTYGKTILRSGALYIRTSSSNTEEVSSPDEWDNLISVALRKQNDELLGRFSKLLEQIQKGTPTKPEPEFPNWFSSKRQTAETEMEEAGFEKNYFEVISYLPNNFSEWDQTQLLNAMTKSESRKSGWPQGVVLHVDDHKPKAVRDGIQAIIAAKTIASFDYWFLSQTGNYYFCRTYHEDYRENRKVPTLDFDIRIEQIAEAIDHTVRLYTELGVDNGELIVLAINHRGLKGRRLTANNASRAFTMRDNRVSQEDVAIWNTTSSLDELKFNRNTYTSNAIRAITIYFDFFEPEQQVIDSIINEYNGI